LDNYPFLYYFCPQILLTKKSKIKAIR